MMLVITIVNSLLALTNVILGFTLAFYQFRFWRCNGHTAWKWIKLGMGVLGLYWGMLYLVILVDDIFPFIDPIYFMAIFVRPAITVSLALCTSAAIVRWQDS